MPDETRKGNYGEAVARGYLERRGFAVLEMNYKRAGGEIDIIARDGDGIVFIEVKYRRSLAAGLPRIAVTPSKQRAIIQTAQYYIAENELTDVDMRFDVVEVFGREQLDVNHIQNAFWVRQR